MKSITSIITCCITLFFASIALAQDPIVVNKSDKTVYVQMSMDQDYTVFGYANTKKDAGKVICFSSFTKEVDGNPNKCRLGAYYTSDDIQMNYLGVEGDFIKVAATTSKGKGEFYLKKSEVVFED